MAFDQRRNLTKYILSYEIDPRKFPGSKEAATGKWKDRAAVLLHHQTGLSQRPVPGKPLRASPRLSVPCYLMCGYRSVNDQADSQRTSSASHFKETFSSETTKGLTLKKLHEGCFNAAARNWQPVHTRCLGKGSEVYRVPKPSGNLQQPLRLLKFQQSLPKLFFAVIRAVDL